MTTAVDVGLVADGYHDFTRGSDGHQLASQAQHAEGLGFTHFALSDHLHSTTPTFDPWTALTWVAATTTKITVVTDVLGLPYRAPTVVAKMAESLQRLSGDRLALGLGNGGYDREFRAFGLPERTPGQRVAALDEAISLIRSLWARSDVTVQGVHYRADGAQIQPRPTRSVPIWLGAYGPRSLAQTGAIADGWLPSLGRVTVDQLRDMRTTVRAAAERAGRDPDTLTYACNVPVDFDGNARGASTDKVRAQLQALAGVGFDTLLISGLSTARAREQFAGRVLPELT